MRLLVSGCNGQIARALQALDAPAIEIVALGRPELDLQWPDTLAPTLRTAAPDLIVNAAAYTAVDQAESEPATARAVNADGAGALARAAAEIGAPVIQLSTDYVFDGAKAGAYLETDAPAPINAYGASKLAGENAVRAAQPDHVILRMGWVYSPYGANFARTMLRLAATRDEIAVVQDQRGAPCSALEIANAIVQIAANLMARRDAAQLRGVFHLSPAGDASWAEFAEAIFAYSAAHGGPRARVRPISSAEYPTAARRPANSLLDAGKLAAAHGVRLPHWRTSLPICLNQLIR